MQLPDADFLQLLQKDFGFRLGRFLKSGKRQVFPLSLVTAEEQIRPGVVLLGNSAHTLHPVAGQGFNLAFREALVLAEVVRDAVGKGLAAGDIKVLQTYIDRIRQDQQLTIGFSDSLTTLFSSSNNLSRFSRKAGLLGIDMLSGLKTILAKQAMGMNGRKARLNHT
jgi:2-polyprenyl-6-methoxyphenol hydroxylase-like FAD-dependent oxidoreductase